MPQRTVVCSIILCIYLEDEFSEVRGHKGRKKEGRGTRPRPLRAAGVTEVAALSDAHTFAEWHHADGKG